ncbi:MAG: hypothetical protein PHE79_11715 [Eubacteriales bacterium]|nr:hypothetical protein [Eubacteriales bacterium]
MKKNIVLLILYIGAVVIVTHWKGSISANLSKEMLVYTVKYLVLAILFSESLLLIAIIAEKIISRKPIQDIIRTNWHFALFIPAVFFFGLISIYLAIALGIKAIILVFGIIIMQAFIIAAWNKLLSLKVRR